MNEQVFQCLREVFETNTPFSNFLGVRIMQGENCRPYVMLNMQPVCVGNYMQNILHGGVISTLLDIAGAVIAVEGVLSKNKELPKCEMMKKFEKLGTIDLRIDYLRPGRGEYFIAKGEALRVGNKVTVVRTELKNNEDLLLAVGTGTYMVG